MSRITRITRLRNCGVFRDFEWPSDLWEFGRYNLIYGWNGTGKTTLSRVLRALELRQRPVTGEVVLDIGGNQVRGEHFPYSSLFIRVFNSDFVEENVFQKNGGELPPIFVFGKESIEKQKEVERLKIERDNKENERNAAHDKRRRAERDFGKHCIDRAKVIKQTLRVSGPSPYNEYDKRKYQSRAEQMVADGDSAKYRLTETERDALLRLHRATPKPKVPEITYRPHSPQDLASKVSELLSTTVVSVAIQRLKEDPALAEWVRHGLWLHKERNSNICLFCEQSLPSNCLAELEVHFNAEYERLMQSIDDQMRSLEEIGKNARELKLPHRAELNDDLATEYDQAEQDLRQALNIFQEFVSQLITALKEKKKKPFSPLTLRISVGADNTAIAVNQVNEIVRRHNEACDDFDRRVSETRDRLALDMIAESLDEFVRLQDAVQQAAESVKKAGQAIKRLDLEIARLESEIVEHRRPAEELNEDLRK